MGSEWRECRVGDLADIYDGPHATPKTTPEGPIFLGISCLDRGRLDLSKAQHLSEADLLRWTRRVTPTANDVVFSYETRIGEAAKIPPGFRGCLGRRMGLLRPRATVDPDFLLYAFLGPDFQETLRRRTVHGSTVDRILLTELGEFPIRVPPPAEQQRIASALKALDDKIDLNRRMGQTLESMARALFKSCFVELDWVDSPKSLLPGCTPSPLSRLLELERGLSYKGSGLSAAGLPMVTLGCFAGSGHFADQGIKVYAGDYGDRHMVRAGDLVIANTDITQRREVLGSPALVPDGCEAYLFTHHVYAARFLGGKGRLWAPFVYYSLLQEDFRERANGYATGTTVLALPPAAVLDHVIKLPPESEVEAFNAMVYPLLGRQQHARSENRALGDVRARLLPGLLSGDVAAGLGPPRGGTLVD